MELIAATDPLSHSADLTTENIEHLRELFPQAVTEDGGGKRIDFEVLRELLGGELVTGEEKYGLNWHGKRAARRLALTPSTGTLRPAPEDSVDWDTTQNLMIEGDNLEVLKLLQKSYAGKVKMIYIDPPYNTGNDFVYKDDYRDSIGNYLSITGQRGNDDQPLTSNTDSSGRIHTVWLNMLYPRLFVCRQLLHAAGLIFISIGANEVANLTLVCDQLFGEENRVGIISRLMKSGGNSGKFFSPNIEYILAYAKDASIAIAFRDEMDEALKDSVYTQVAKAGTRIGQRYRTMGLYQASLTLDRSRNARYYIECPDGERVIPPDAKRWRVVEETYKQMLASGDIEFLKTATSPLFTDNGKAASWNVYTRIWLENREEAGRVPTDFIAKYENRHSSKELQELNIPFEFAKPSKLIAYLMRIAQIASDDLVLDFFAGSASTAHAVIDLNEEIDQKIRFILVQLPEVVKHPQFATIFEMARERVKRVIERHRMASGQKLDLVKSSDLGFRVFKLDTTSIRPWDPTLPVTEQRLLGEVDNILPGRTEQDLLYELLLKRGLELTVPIVERTLGGKQVFAVSTGDLIACLAPHIQSANVESLAKGIVAWHKELAPPPAVIPNAPLEKPAKFDPPLVVFRDTAFADDVAKSNLTEILKQHSLTDVRSL